MSTVEEISSPSSSISSDYQSPIKTKTTKNKIIINKFKKVLNKILKLNFKNLYNFILYRLFQNKNNNSNKILTGFCGAVGSALVS